MTNDDLRQKTAEIAAHLTEIRTLALSIRSGHPDGNALYRALNCGCLPAEHADPVGLVEDVLQHPHPHTVEDGYERFR